MLIIILKQILIVTIIILQQIEMSGKKQKSR